MTNSEFKAWLEGFSEGIDETPTPKQWKKIQEKIKSLDGNSSVHHYYHAPIYPQPRRYYDYGLWSHVNGGAVGMVANAAQASAVNQMSCLNAAPVIDVAAIMREAGRKDALN